MLRSSCPLPLRGDLAETPVSIEPELVQSLSELVSRWREVIEKSARSRYPEAELKQLAAEDEPFGGSDSAELDLLLRAAHEHEGLSQDLAYLIPSISALGAGIRRLSLTEWAEELQGRPYWLKHECLVRLAWVEWHRIQLANGNFVERPFRFQVSSRNTNRVRDRDRDFATLLMLGHALRSTTGQELFLEVVRETPDFVCRLDGLECGVEATEGVVEDLARSASFQDKALARVRAVLLEGGASVGFEGDFEWPALWAAIDEVERMLRGSLAQESWREGGAASFEIQVGGERVEVELGHLEPGSVSWMGRDGQLREEIEAATALFRSAILARIEAKVAGKKPEIRPCILAIYGNDLGDGDANEAATGLREVDLGHVLSHFDEIWIVHNDWWEPVFGPASRG